MKSIRQEIQQAWSFRNTQRLEECRPLLVQAKASLHLPAGRLDPPMIKEILEKAPPHQFELIVDVVLLAASLARAEGQLEYSGQVIQILAGFFEKAEQRPPFQLPYQQGLNAIFKGDWSSALELFLSARASGRGSTEKALALSHALFCLESLGLPFERTRKELTRLLNQLTDSDPTLEAVRSQIHAFDLRNAFRNGEFAPLMAHARELKPVTKVDQAFYYRLWLDELPFHRGFHLLDRNLKEGFCLSDPEFHQKGYRLRTLQGLLHPDDLLHFKASELADRVYLWTWRWLVDPEELPVQRMMALLRDVDFPSLAVRLTAEDFQMFRNALLWMSLFDPGSFQSIGQVIESLRPSQGRDFPIFEFERLMLSYFHALRDRKDLEASDYLAALRHHPIWKQEGHDWVRLVTHCSGGKEPDKGAYPLTKLESQLRQILHPDARAVETDLRIDFADYRITSKNSRAAIVSRVMCIAFELLHSKGSVDCDEFALLCFGLHRFDPLIHNAKLFNLLARMRKCAPADLKFSVKSGRVYSTGNWGRVEIRKPPALAGSLKEQPEWKLLLRPRAGSPANEATDHCTRPSLIMKRLSGQKQLTRRELESLTGRSRATANRLIARWLRQGILKRKGQAKKTIYIFCPQPGRFA